MIKMVMVSDIHLKQTDAWGVLENGMNSRLRDRLTSLNTAIAYAIEAKADIFYIGGDIFDKLNPSEKLRQHFVNSLVPLLEANISIISLVGNHDTNFDVSNFGAESSIVNSIKKDAIVFINTPTVLDLGEIKAYFVPYGAEIPKDSEGCQVLFGHCGVAGAETGVGVIQRDGEDIDKKSFNSFKFAFLGHYHKPQKILGGSFEIIYSGSLNNWDMSERYDEKRFLEIRFENGKTSWQSISIPDRRFMQFDFKEGESWELKDNIKDSCVKVVFHGSKEWIKALDIDSIKRAYEGWNAHKVSIAIDVEDTKKLGALEINETDTEIDIIERYAREKKIGKELLDIGLKIFNEGNS